MMTVVVAITVNTDNADEAAQVVDEWLGKTAPPEIDTLTIDDILEE